MLVLVTLLGGGFLLGVRHATDPDHVVAVTTIVSRQRSLARAAGVGALWGIGHTVPILFVGGAIIVFGLAVPARLWLAAELLVAAMLIVLGVMNLSGRSERVAESRSRPLAVGFVHGLAGSALVMLLPVTLIGGARWTVAYLVVFGAGTVLGMMLITAAISLPALYAAGRLLGATRYLRLASGVASVAFGLLLAHQVGVVEGLFTGAPGAAGAPE